MGILKARVYMKTHGFKGSRKRGTFLRPSWGTLATWKPGVQRPFVYHKMNKFWPPAGDQWHFGGHWTLRVIDCQRPFMVGAPFWRGQNGSSTNGSIILTNGSDSHVDWSQRRHLTLQYFIIRNLMGYIFDYSIFYLTLIENGNSALYASFGTFCVWISHYFEAQ